MTDNKHSDNALPFKTAIVGAAVGAAAVILSKKEVRDTISKNAKKMFDTGGKKLDEAIDHAEKAKNSIAKKVDKTTKALED